MKTYKTIFSFLLYESILVFFFGGVLYLINDPISKILVFVSIISFAVAFILGIAGYSFGLLKSKDSNHDF